MGIASFLRQASAPCLCQSRLTPTAENSGSFRISVRLIGDALSLLASRSPVPLLAAAGRSRACGRRMSRQPGALHFGQRLHRDFATLCAGAQSGLECQVQSERQKKLQTTSVNTVGISWKHDALLVTQFLAKVVIESAVFLWAPRADTGNAPAFALNTPQQPRLHPPWQRDLTNLNWHVEKMQFGAACDCLTAAASTEPLRI